MEQWKEIMTSANRAYEGGREVEAEELYKAACQRATFLLTQCEDREAAVAMLSVSNQNLADLYFRQGRCDEALTAYGKLLRHLEQLSQEEGVHSQFAAPALHKVGTELSQEVRARKLVVPEDHPDLEPVRDLIT